MKNYYVTILIVIAIIAIGLLIYFNNLPSRVPNTSNQAESQTNGTNTQSNSQSGTGSSSSVPNVPASKNSGRVVLLVSDSANRFDTFESIILTINEISVKNSQGKWVRISTAPIAVDLLGLYKSTRTGKFIDTNLTAGTYNGLKISIGNIVLTGKSGLKNQSARLLSSSLTLNNKLVVEKGKISAISIDFPTAKALVQATDGSFLYFPVVKLSTQHDISNVQTLGGNTQILNGLTDFDQTWGVDENGTLKPDYTFNGLSKIELLGNVLHVIPFDENPTEIKVPANTAVSNAVSNGYISSALSVQTVMRQSKRVWQVVGLKSGKMTTVFLDIVTGEVIGTQ